MGRRCTLFLFEPRNGAGSYGYTLAELKTNKQTIKNNQTQNLDCITQKDEFKIDHKPKCKTNPVKFLKNT